MLANLTKQLTPGVPVWWRGDGGDPRFLRVNDLIKHGCVMCCQPARRTVRPFSLQGSPDFVVGRLGHIVQPQPSDWMHATLQELAYFHNC